MEATDDYNEIVDGLVAKATHTEETTEAPDDEPEAEDQTEVDDDGAPPEGDDDEGNTEDESDEADEGDEQPLYTVKVNGREEKVTLEDLTRSYSGQEYIQQRMKENAEAKRQVEALQAQYEQGAQAVAQLYQQLQSGQLAPEPTPPSIELLNTDPMRYMREKEAFEVRQREYLTQQQQIASVFQQRQQAQSEAMRLYMAEQARELVQHMPELADPATAGRVQSEMISAGEAYGYSSDEINGVMDSRALRVLRDAARWRALRGRQSAVTEKASKARPVMKPGAKATETGKQASREKARARMKDEGSPEAAVNFLLSKVR